MTTDTKPANTPRTTVRERRPWTMPTSMYRGSVTELVQIAKTSGNNDCSGHKRNGTGTHC